MREQNKVKQNSMSNNIKILQIFNSDDATYSLSKLLRPINAPDSIATIGFMLRFLQMHRERDTHTLVVLQLCPTTKYFKCNALANVNSTNTAVISSINFRLNQETVHSSEQTTNTANHPWSN